MAHCKTTLAIAGAALLITLVLTRFLGGEFMPKLEEGNLWVRATLPQDVSYEASARNVARYPRNPARLSGRHAGRLADWPAG